MYNNGKTSNQLWAVVNENGEIVWSRGGSSSSPKIMTYESEKRAESALKNVWTKQVHNESELKIVKVYQAKQAN